MKHIGVVTLLVGVILLTIGLTLVRWKSWSPVKVALPLKAGNHAEVPFRAEFSARHNIYLTVKRGVDWEHTNCLLGAEVAPSSCKDVPSVVDVYWTVFSQGNLIAQGDSTRWLGARGGSGRLIGMFEVKKSMPYTFSISVKRDGIALNALNPEVTVEVDDRILEQYIIEAAILQWIGGIGLAVGLIVFIWSLSANAPNKTT